MYGRAPAASCRLQVTGDRERQPTISSAVPVSPPPSPVTSSVGFVALPRFQAEVEGKLLGRPQHPVVVHHRGRIISLDEAGEQAGLKVGMRLHQAHAIYPEAEFIPLNADRYQPFWREVLDLCVAHLGSVEPREPGEVFVNLAGLKHPEEALAQLRQAIEARTGLTCRTGCGPSKLVARLGTGTHSLDPLPITELWPLDAKTLEQLQALGITTIGLLRCVPSNRLAEHFGREARRLHDLARGLDHSPVQPLYPPREIVVRQTLPGGTDNPDTLDRCLSELAAKASRELRRRQEVGGRVALHITLQDEPPVTASLRLREPSEAEHDLLRACRGLLKRLSLAAPVAAVALTASECRRETGRQLNLFYDTRALTRRRERSSQALELVRECFGQDVAVLGREMELPRRERVLAAFGN